METGVEAAAIVHLTEMFSEDMVADHLPVPNLKSVGGIYLGTCGLSEEGVGIPKPRNVVGKLSESGSFFLRNGSTQLVGLTGKLMADY